MSRLVVVETVYHQHDGDPVACETRYAMPLKASEQAYQRTYVVDQDAPLDYGWNAEPSLVVVQNLGKVEVLLSMGGVVFARIAPIASARFQPAGRVHATALEPCKVRIYSFPG